MNFNSEPIKNWFGFTRRERRSAFSLLLIIILVLGVRYTIPESRIKIEYTTGTDSTAVNHSGLAATESSYSEKQFLSRTITTGKLRKPRSSQQKSRIDINKCDSATLIRLRGIGPVLSARIIKYRQLLGGFAGIDQLKEVYGLPEETYESIKGQIFADSAVINRININSAGYKELLRFPYFEKYEVTAIMKYRQLKGRMNGMDDLTENRLIKADKAKRVSPYLNFSE